MAKIRVSSELLDEMLFKGLDAHITNAVYDSHGEWVEFEIEGEDVPAEAEAVVICTKAVVICTKYDDPGADPFTTVEIRGRIGT